MTKTKLLSITFIVSLLFFINGGVTLAAPLATPAEVSTSASDYTVLAPLPCVESPDAKYVDSNGIVQTIPGSAIKCDGGNGAVQPTVSFKTYVQYMMNLLIALAAVAAVVMIVVGGIEYMTAATPFGKGDGKKKVTNAIGGLLLVLCSYLLLRTIDPRLVEIPNTLVPEITLKADLAVDASKNLRDRLESDANKYQVKRIDIEAQLRQANIDKTAKEAELAVIQKKLESLTTEDPQAAALLKDEARIEDEINNLNINYETAIIKRSLNSRMLRAIEDASNSAINDQTKIKKLNEGKDAISSQSTFGKQNLVDLGQSDTGAIDQEAKYSLTTIDLTKIDLIIINAERSLGVPYTTGTGSYNPNIEDPSKIYITMQNINGTGFEPKALLTTRKAEMQAEINKAKTVRDSLTDQTLKNELTIKIDKITFAFEAKFRNSK